MASNMKGKTVSIWTMFKTEDLMVLAGEFKIACHKLHISGLINDKEYKEKLIFIKQFEDVLYEDKKKKEKS